MLWDSILFNLFLVGSPQVRCNARPVGCAWPSSHRPCWHSSCTTGVLTPTTHCTELGWKASFPLTLLFLPIKYRTAVHTTSLPQLSPDLSYQQGGGKRRTQAPKLLNALVLSTITPTPRNHEKGSGASGVSTNPASTTAWRLLRWILSSHAGGGGGLCRERGAWPALLQSTLSQHLSVAWWTWKFSSPAGLNDTRDGEKVNYLLAPTYTTLFHFIDAK